jgi:hypothetical protein
VLNEQLVAEQTSLKAANTALLVIIEDLQKRIAELEQSKE